MPPEDAPAIVDAGHVWGPDRCQGSEAYQRLARSLAPAILLLAGCTGLFAEPEPGATDAMPLPIVEPSPLMAFIATARQGQTATLEDPDTRAMVEILAGRTYNAASGRQCRPFYVVSGPAYLGRTTGLACEQEQGRWSLSELTVNPENLDR